MSPCSNKDRVSSEFPLATTYHFRFFIQCTVSIKILYITLENCFYKRRNSFWSNSKRMHKTAALINTNKRSCVLSLLLFRLSRGSIILFRFAVHIRTFIYYIYKKQLTRAKSGYYCAHASANCPGDL